MSGDDFGIFGEQPFRGVCPYCGYEYEFATATSPDHPTPKAGDYNVCINCESVSAFGVNGTVEKMTVENWRRLASDPERLAQVRLLQRSLQHIHRQNRARKYRHN